MSKLYITRAGRVLRESNCSLKIILVNYEIGHFDIYFDNFRPKNQFLIWFLIKIYTFLIKLFQKEGSRIVSSNWKIKNSPVCFENHQNSQTDHFWKLFSYLSHACVLLLIPSSSIPFNWCANHKLNSGWTTVYHRIQRIICCICTWQINFNPE